MFFPLPRSDAWVVAHATGIGAGEIASFVEKVKDTLDVRIESAVYGDETVSSDRRLTAIRLLRLGVFKRVKWLNLLDQSDTSPSDNPLQAVAKTSDPMVTFCKICTKATAIISVGAPELALNALQFFNELQTFVSRQIGRGADWPTISAWFSKICVKVSVGAEKYTFGDGGRRGPDLDMDYLKEKSEHRDKLEDKIVDAVAAAAAKASSSSKGGGASSSSGKDQKLANRLSSLESLVRKNAGVKKPGDKKRKHSGKNKKKAKAKSTAGAAVVDDDDEDDTDGGDDDDDGGDETLPSGAEMTQFVQRVGKYKGKNPCWWHHESKAGCANPRCTFWHDKDE